MLKEILNRFLIINGVVAAVVIEENGEIVESIKSGIVLDRNFESILSCFMLDSKTIALTFENPVFSLVVLEYEENFLIMGPLLEEFFLIVIAKNTANIGQITYEMKKNQESIVSLL